MKRRLLPPSVLRHAGCAPRLAWMASLVLGALAALGLGGCRDLDAYALEPGETYCGSLVHTPVFTDGMLPGGVPPAMRMRLDLDVDHLSTQPGTIRTDDADRGLCKDDGQPLFADAPLRTIEPVLRDAISQAVIGDGREQNFFTYVSSSCGHQMMAVVSLMHSGGVEVRIFKPAAAPEKDADRGDRPGFGLFTLERKSEKDCGFGEGS